MATVSGFPRSCLGLIHRGQSGPQFRIHRCNEIRFNNQCSTWLESMRIPGGKFQHFAAEQSSNKRILSAGTDRYQLNYEDELPQEPFWLTLIKEAIWGLKSLSAFLVEQPSQLKYIEWPTFGSTLKTATLTLVIVALLIVALWSVDSVLCYLLALFPKRTS